MTNQREKFIILLLILFALSLRLTLLTQKNLWFDEIYSWHITQGSIDGIIQDTSSDIHPPFYYVLLKIWNNIFSDSVFSMRILSALFTTGTILFIFVLSRRILNFEQTFFVILLYTLSPLNIFYSQEVRMSALNIFLNLGSVFYLLKLMDNQQKQNIIYKNKYAYLFILFTTLSLYTHYFSIPIFISLIIFTTYYYRKSFKQIIPYLILFLIIFLLYTSWIPIMLEQGIKGQPWRHPQSIIMILKEITNYTRDLSLGLYYSDINLTLLRVITIIIIFIGAASAFGFIKNLRRNPDSNLSSSIILIALLITIPFCTAILISFNQKIEFFRYLSILIPFILICIVYGLSSYNNKLFLVSLILVISINIYGLYLYYSKDYKNNDYRQIISEISQNYNQDDKVIVEPHYYGWIIDYYIKENNLQMDKTSQYGWRYEMILDSLSKNKPDNFWLVNDYSSIDTSYFVMLQEGIQNNYIKVYERYFDIIPQKVKLYYYRKKL